jgi:outer membrane protein assembly factor BamD
MKTLVVALFFVIAAMVSGCSSNADKLQDMSEKELYEHAQESLNDESFAVAIKNLQLLEARYPFGAYAEQAQLEIIYAHYRNFEPEAASAAAERFIRLHPQHPNVDYAYYMKGLANYAEGEGLPRHACYTCALDSPAMKSIMPTITSPAVLISRL